ncbi:MAG: CdaR family protein [Anaerolineaceae bacterium]|nr:CdaR family protein [Anaerolineaceae bacterium]
MKIWKIITRNFPSLLLAFALAVAVWISAVTAQDPTEQRIYPGSIPIEVVGQDPGLLLMGEVPSQLTLTLNAPQSVWGRLSNQPRAIRAVVDLSGLDAGSFDVPVQVQMDERPAEIVSYSPGSVLVTLEPFARKEIDVRLIQRGDVATGYQSELPTWEPDTVTISGPESVVNQVNEVRAILDLNRTSQDIQRVLSLTAVNAEGTEVKSVDISPKEVQASITVTQRGGYRNVVVKVVASGQVASGYRVTNISVFPPTITVFSYDPMLVDELPGYVDTATLDLTGANEDQDLKLPLNLPPGVAVVGDQTVSVQVGVDPIEGSLTLSDMPVTVVGLDDGLAATVSPEIVDVIISGPLPVLDGLLANDVRVVINMQGEGTGTYQRVPVVEFTNTDSGQLRVESILPGSIEIQIVRRR